MLNLETSSIWLIMDLSLVIVNYLFVHIQALVYQV